MASTHARPLRTSLLLLGLMASISLSACSMSTMSGESGGGQRVAGAAPDAGGAAPGDSDSDQVGADPGDGGTSGDSKPGETKPGAASPEEPVRSDPDPGVPPSDDGVLKVEPQPGIVDSRPHVIDRISVASDGRTVTVYWWGGVESCYGLDKVRVERDADGAPVITVLEGTLPGLGEVACIEIALLKSTTITLDEPLFQDGSQH